MASVSYVSQRNKNSLFSRLKTLSCSNFLHLVVPKFFEGYLAPAVLPIYCSFPCKLQ